MLSVIFGQNRDHNSRSTTEERHSTSPSKELQESPLDLTQSSLSDIGDGEVHVMYCTVILHAYMYTQNVYFALCFYMYVMIHVQVYVLYM